MFFRFVLIAVMLAMSACSSHSPSPAASANKVAAGTYKVKRGDTLYSIASRHGWSFKELARYNGISAPYAVNVGQTIRFGGAKTTTQTRTSTASKARPVAATTKVTLSGWAWPIQGTVIRRFSAADKLNKGIRIAATQGQPVFASLAGKVAFAVNIRGYGNLIILQHGTSHASVYGHNSKLLVKEGQTVSKGQKIAEAGDLDTDRVQLYFEIRQNGKPIDPLSVLPAS
ncbi:peptidoglycan DD-metalloendopeptidase family protein [Pseudomonas rubra]|uniref:Peptidoglycan DD-metalloendopeptidase family protein n=1 Tax=Pseudomonas rubra TaxID=2942627 RepID=A0ABT5P959_9PSED|nr:peptidoglycan DD-metalloendopeptidase family protein [Pseudomonas rubra]MDD1014770.1 peptidoglycan DD-metalloendopeptidase family protein [Pseudomonas rubra]MDD1040781.1 peptidoglycan DD-metalloendopeptidase family protein [Pseudomonas rubra]MDD1157689.1 peptidoglycan DD-metalloendopeptidase family protein [Pseudomonas rubra]